jgi:hypothetical protein
VGRENGRNPDFLTGVTEMKAYDLPATVIIVDNRPLWMRCFHTVCMIVVMGGAIAEIAGWLNIHL